MTVCLDVTRLLSRIGRGALTGVDRVEAAYLRHYLDAAPDLRLLCRTTRGYILMGRDGGAHLLALAEGRIAVGRADLLSRLTGRGGRMRHRAEAALRPFARDRCLRGGLGPMLARAMTGPVRYINVGLSNLSSGTLAAFAAHPQARIAVMIHDLIPVIQPDFAAPGQPARFAALLERVRVHADTVICNSQATADALEDHWNGGPPRIVAHLGVDVVPQAVMVKDPRLFVTIGTIEPRKNHALLLDVWEMLARDLPPAAMPVLHIIGHRGWRSDALMARLYAHPLLGTVIFLHDNLDDGAMMTLLAQANALLFPTLAEGFGLPPLEAIMAGTMPICSDLSVLREILGDCAVYLPPADAYSWLETIKQSIDGKLPGPDLTMARIPTWDRHFDTVDAALDAAPAGT